MSKNFSLLAVFEELDQAANAVDTLRELGLGDEQMNVISGIPITEAMMGRKPQWSNVSRLAMSGAVSGFLLGVALAVGTPLLYPLSVGGQPLIPVPPSIVVIFETTMLGLLVSTFIGVFLDSRFPAFGPVEYVPEISDGKTAILFECSPEAEDKFTQAMKSLGAESVKPAEAKPL